MVDVFFFFLRNWMAWSQEISGLRGKCQVLNKYTLDVFQKACITWHQWYYSIYIWFCVIFWCTFFVSLVELNQKKPTPQWDSWFGKDTCEFANFPLSLDPPATGYFSWNCGTCQLPDMWQMNEQDDQIQIKGLPTAMLKVEKASWAFLKARYKSSNFNFHQQLNKITTKTVKNIKNQLHRRWAGHKSIVIEPLITCNMRGFTPKFCLYAMKQCSWVLWRRVSSCDFLCVNRDICNKFLGFSFSFWMMATGG